MEQKEYYNGHLAEKYYRIAGETNEHFDTSKDFIFLRQFVPEKASICELWCGEGSKLIAFKDFAQSLSGIDISREGIMRAKNAHPEIDFRVGDIERTDFASESFDVTMSFFVLEHTDDPSRAIAEMLRITRK